MSPKRVDRNQPEIVAALRSVGASVQTLHEVGRGCPDLLVGIRGQCFVLEVKDGLQPPSRQALTPDEERWEELWQGQYAVVRSVDEALAAIGIEVER